MGRRYYIRLTPEVSERVFGRKCIATTEEAMNISDLVIEDDNRVIKGICTC